MVMIYMSGGWGFSGGESCPTQAVLPWVALAADKIIRDRHVSVWLRPGDSFDDVVNSAVPLPEHEY